MSYLYTKVLVWHTLSFIIYSNKLLIFDREVITVPRFINLKTYISPRCYKNFSLSSQIEEVLTETGV